MSITILDLSEMGVVGIPSGSPWPFISFLRSRAWDVEILKMARSFWLKCTWLGSNASTATGYEGRVPPFPKACEGSVGGAGEVSRLGRPQGIALTLRHRHGRSRGIAPTVRHRPGRSRGTAPTLRHRLGRSRRIAPTLRHGSGRARGPAPTFRHRAGRGRRGDGPAPTVRRRHGRSRKVALNFRHTFQQLFIPAYFFVALSLGEVCYVNSDDEARHLRPGGRNCAEGATIPGERGCATPLLPNEAVMLLKTL